VKETALPAPLTKRKREKMPYPTTFERYVMGTPPETPTDPGTWGSFFQTNPFPLPDLLTVDDVAGLLQLGKLAAYKFIRRTLPEYAVVMVGSRLRVHSWALAHILNMTTTCPGCGRPWEDA
jgi:hypothetical protein